MLDPQLDRLTPRERMRVLGPEAVRRSLLSFNCFTRRDYVPAPFHVELCRALQDVEAGRVDRLLVLCPPGHGKSVNFSIQFPAWIMGRHPTWNIGACSHTAELAYYLSGKARDVVSSENFRLLFPEIELARDREGNWGTKQGGYYLAGGVGGALLGRRLNLLLLDDPVKNPEQVRSFIQREHLSDWYQSVALTRLEPGAALVVIMHRWHLDDLADRAMKAEPGRWRVLRFPAIQDREPTADDPRPPGAALWPERFPLDVLTQKRQEVGPAAWSALYQQAPINEGGNQFNPAWWKYFNGDRPRFKRVIQSWDSAFKTGAQNDWTVCETWAEAAAGYYLLDVFRARVAYPDFKRMVKAMRDSARPSAILIEDAASGQSVIQDFRATDLPIIAIRPDRDKLARSAPATGLAEAGKIFLPEDAPWLAEFIRESSEFPSGKFDDQVDAMSQAINYLRMAPEPAF